MDLSVPCSELPIIIAMLLPWLVGTFLMSIRRTILSLHLLQLDSYLNHRLWIWLRRDNGKRLFDYQIIQPSALLLILAAALPYLTPLHLYDIRGFVVFLALAWAVLGYAHYKKFNQENQKKPLVYTGRAKRILVLAILIQLFFFISIFSPLFHLFDGEPIIPLFLSGTLTTQLAALSIPLANFLLTPVQWGINRFYLEMARRKIRQAAPTTIGIAGSYGKTSTKYFLETIISGYQPTLKTPLSYNTLMGLSKVINESLTAEHKLFIAELGEYLPGDITELADLVQPKIGILTAVGPQHLERFKTMENIEKTMFELIEALPKDGVIALNGDDEVCRKFIPKSSHLQQIIYGVDCPPELLTIKAKDISLSTAGMEFTITLKNGEQVRVSTKIVGRHNIRNILAAVGVAAHLGMPLEAIKEKIATLEPAPHRLQISTGAGGVTVIDDSYNSNPVGSAEALEVLKLMGTGQKVLVTPGMVELGSQETELNRCFGRLAAEACNHVILVGPKQTEPIQAGLRDAGFPASNLHVVTTLQEATAELAKIVRSGDVVLFENDLPDLYAE